MYSRFLFGLICFVVASAYADRIESTHLVTMRKVEFMKIVECASKLLNPVLCNKFIECEKLLPQQVMMATTKCKKECMVGGVRKCSLHEPLFDSPEIPYKIFDCVLENTHKLNAEENKKMVEYEKCIRDFHTNSCKPSKHQEDFYF